MPDPSTAQPADPADLPDAGGGPAHRSRRAVVSFIVLFLSLLAADLAFKYWAFANVPRGEGWTLVPNVLALRLTVNHGAVFGMMQGQKIFFIFASAAAVVMIGYFFSQSRAGERSIHAALAAILAGAMGNLYDRIVHNGVRDMLLIFPDVKLPWGLRWPSGMDEVYPWIFNLADVFLLAGIAVIVIRSLWGKTEAGSPEKR